MVIAIGIAGVVYLVNARNQTNISNVFSQQSQAANRLGNELHGLPSIPQIQRAWQDFAQGVQAIDVSSCPKDFQLAWFDYISAVKDLSQEHTTASFTANTIKGLLEIGMSAVTKNVKLTEDALRDPYAEDVNRMAECFRRCQRIAISHGVSFHPAVNQQQN